MPPEKGGTKKSPNATTSSRIKSSGNKTSTSGNKSTIINGRRPTSSVGEPTTLYSILATADSKTTAKGNTASPTVVRTTSPATSTMAETTTTTDEISSTTYTAVQVESSGESQQSIGGILNSFNNMVSNFLQRFSFG
jgi:hypothetical protein